METANAAYFSINPLNQTQEGLNPLSEAVMPSNLLLVTAVEPDFL